MLALFDFLDPTVSRDVTNVPLQELFLLNGGMKWQQAERLAERLNAESADDAARIDQAYRLLYGRKAGENEIRQGLKFLEE